jgi:hypothetical protein
MGADLHPGHGHAHDERYDHQEQDACQERASPSVFPPMEVVAGKKGLH